MSAEPREERGDVVSRRRYDRERRAREEAEALLEAKSRELFEANESLERLVAARTAELTRALAAAEEAGAMRARFIAVMSHEIRTPLAGLLGMLELMRSEALSPQTRELMEAAAQSAESLKRIVDDVLDLSALDAGRMHFEAEPVDLRALARGVFALLAPRAAAKGLALRLAIADDVPERMLGDATRLRQVLSNLCDNAVKFSTRGTVSLSAEMVPGADGPRLRVVVCDEGPGIAADEIPRLFADFGQLDAGLTRRAEGTGLGLSICRRIVEGLGGRIGVESEPGAGAAFWVELPARPVAAGAAEPSRPPARGAGADLRGRRILVAEDNPVNRRVIGGYLARLGAEHYFAVDGAEAVRLAAERRFDAILMDIAMPEMDGVSAAIAIRAGGGPSRDTPIIAFTAHVMPSVQAECRAAGMAEVLAKPAGFEEIAATLARHAGAATDAATAAVSQQALASGDAPADLLEAFRADARDRIGRIAAAIGRGDVEAVRAQAHAIRGAAALLGFGDAHEIATALEEGAPYLSHDDIAEALRDLADAVAERDGGAVASAPAASARRPSPR